MEFFNKNLYSSKLEIDENENIPKNKKKDPQTCKGLITKQE